MIYIQ